jgi:hypothetical protein
MDIIRFIHTALRSLNEPEVKGVGFGGIEEN